MAKKKQYDDAFLYRIAELFFKDRLKVSDIAEKLDLSREAVYPLLSTVMERGFVKLVPPIATELVERLAEKLRCRAETVTVVNTVEGTDTGEQVATTAAELALGLIMKIHKSGRDPVCVGLGPGRATLAFSRQLSRLMQAQVGAPKLKLFAISAGCPALSPEFASVSFFNLFPKSICAGCVGLFAETLVKQQEFEDIKARPGVKEAFAERDEVDILITAMGFVDDDHDLLRIFLEQAGESIAGQKADKGWIGNVQYRPFSEKGPVTQKKNELRAVTLFELEDFVRLAQTKDKHVLLMARQCTLCSKTKARALLPLFRNAKLKVWSELVMDVATAQELLKLAEQSAAI